MLPPFKGKKKIARYFFSKSFLQTKDNMLLGKYDVIYKVPNYIDSIGFELLVDGIYERNTIDFLVNKVPTEAVFLDIGANIGSICLPLAKKRKDITVYSFEASKSIFENLKQNIDLNALHNVKAYHIALSDHSQDNVAFYAPSEKFGKGSFAPVFTLEAEYVSSQTLDSFLEEFNITAVDFIKIDVEGFEYFVFKGAEKELSKADAPDILFEFVDWAEEQALSNKMGKAQEILFEMGYKLYRFSDAYSFDPLHSVIKKGASLIFATKKVMLNV
jgi:FkbM family methyltransferase